MSICFICCTWCIEYEFPVKICTELLFSLLLLFKSIVKRYNYFLYNVCFALYTVSWFHCFNARQIDYSILLPRSFFTTPRNKIIIKWPPRFLIQVQLKKKFAILLLASFVTIWQKMGKFGECFKNHGAFGAPYCL